MHELDGGMRGRLTVKQRSSEGAARAEKNVSVSTASKKTATAVTLLHGSLDGPPTSTRTPWWGKGERAPEGIRRGPLFFRAVGVGGGNAVCDGVRIGDGERKSGPPARSRHSRNSLSQRLRRGHLQTHRPRTLPPRFHHPGELNAALLPAAPCLPWPPTAPCAACRCRRRRAALAAQHPSCRRPPPCRRTATRPSPSCRRRARPWRAWRWQRPC